MKYLATTIEFLLALFSDPVALGKLMARTRSRKDGKERSHWLHTLGEVAYLVHRARRAREAFFCVVLHDKRIAKRITRLRWPAIKDPSARASHDSAMAMPALWAEIEIVPGQRLGRAQRNPGNLAWDPSIERVPKTPTKQDLEAAFKVLEAFELPPSIVVDAGDVLQVYWLLKDLWELETAADRNEASDLLRRLQSALFVAAAPSGRWVEHSGDLCQLMRLPDSLNLDWPGGRPVQVIHFPRIKTPGAGATGDHRYHPDDFRHLPPAVEESALERLLRDTAAPLLPSRGVDLEPIVEGCLFFEHSVLQARRLEGKAYDAALGIAGRGYLRGLDGRDVCHRLSQPHPGDNPLLTEEKLALALRRDAPTCQQLARLGGLCRRCRHFGNIETPLELGLEAASSRSLEPSLRDDACETPEVSSSASPSASSGGRVARIERPRTDRVEISLTLSQDEVIAQTLVALAGNGPRLFDRGGVLVEVLPSSAGRDDPPRADPPRVRSITSARLRELMAASCTYRAGEAGSNSGTVSSRTMSSRTMSSRTIAPPVWLARAILDRGRWPELPTLTGVVECPVLRPDGSVLQTAGYDPASGLLYEPSGEFREVPETPTREAARLELERLLEAVADFPFAAEVHRAAWLCSLLTPLARAAFVGPSPLHLIDANVRGCGKSLLADVVAVLLTDRPAPRGSLPGRETELRKMITGLALEAERTVLLDNVSGRLGTPTLDRALTAEIWRDRVVGTHRRVALPLDVTWTATGNHLRLAADTARRCLHIRLSSTLDRPEKRDDFRHLRLLEWVRRERGRLLPAALTLLRAYEVAGRPPQPLEAWGSFEGWSDRVRSTVVWLGMPDPATTREALEMRSAGLHENLIVGLGELLDDLGGPATTRQILDRLDRDDKSSATGFPRLRAALAEMFPHLAEGELPSGLRLAGRLRSYRGLEAHGARIDQATGRRGVARWTVHRADP